MASYVVGGEIYSEAHFRSLSEDEKADLIVEWFRERYEDPAERTPYNGREGGYLWIHGGPYDADEAIQSEFSDVASMEIMQKAVEEITADGTLEWAPVPSDSDYDDPDDRDYEAQPENRATFAGRSFVGRTFAVSDPSSTKAWVTEAGNPITDGRGNRIVFSTGPSELTTAELQQEMLYRLDVFEAMLRQYASTAANRGHNNPPELLAIEPPVTKEQLEELEQAVTVIRDQAVIAEPDTAVIKTENSRLRKFAAWLIGTAGAGVVGGLAWEGARQAYENRDALHAAAFNAVEAVSAWANSLQNFI